MHNHDTIYSMFSINHNYNMILNWVIRNGNIMMKMFITKHIIKIMIKVIIATIIIK